MALETVVTERDKRLIVLLGLFLIVIGLIWIFIKPTFDDMLTLRTEIATQQTTADALQQHINLIPTRKQEVTALKGEVKTAAKDLYGRMESQEIDNLLTNMALDYGFAKSDLRELTIQNSGEFLILAPYLSTDENEAVTMTGIYGVEVTFTLYGTREKLQPFLNLLVNKHKSIRVKDFIWTQDNTNDKNYYLNLGLEIYMTNKEES